MNSFGSLFVLCLLLLQTLQIASMITSIKTSDTDPARPHVARRLRAPLMSRSSDISSPIENSDDIDLDFNHRRFNQIFLTRRRMVNSKRRGPLFG